MGSEKSWLSGISDKLSEADSKLRTRVRSWLGVDSLTSNVSPIEATAANIISPLFEKVNEASFAAEKSTMLPGRTNGPSDAYRHLLWGAELTRVFGEPFARALLSAHEAEALVLPKDLIPADSAMDDHNNEIALQIGSKARSWEEAQALVQRLMQETLARQRPEDINNKNWHEEPNGHLTLPGTVDLGNGLIVKKPSLLPYEDWKFNPAVKENGKIRRLENSECNWPDGSSKWLSNFSKSASKYDGSERYAPREVVEVAERLPNASPMSLPYYLASKTQEKYSR